MMAAVFALETIAIGLAWSGQRSAATAVFFASLVLAGSIFAMHATSDLNLSF